MRGLHIFGCLDNNIKFWSTRTWGPLTRTLNCHLVVEEEYDSSHVRFKMADNPPRSSDGYSQSKSRSERYSLAQAMELFWSVDGDNSEMEDLSDPDDPVGDAEYQPPRQEPSSSEEDSSGFEDPIPQPCQPIRGRKRFHDEYEGYRSDRDIARSRTPRRRSKTQQDEADVSLNVPEETTPGPSHQKQSKKGCGRRWKASSLTPNQAQFEHEEETVQDREGWTPLDYMQQHDNDNSDFSEQEDDPDVSVQGKKRPVKAVPHVSVRRRANAHLCTSGTLEECSTMQSKRMLREKSSAVWDMQGVPVLTSRSQLLHSLSHIGVNIFLRGKKWRSTFGVQVRFFMFHAMFRS